MTSADGEVCHVLYFFLEGGPQWDPTPASVSNPSELIRFSSECLKRRAQSS
ncbi:hypothetical protein HMPREF3223_01087 [Cutibacterium avidum]|uniref:Uncharacterized protein n=1 Tax=Cutibacterium avidum ATCC 25577 TaxID=997355 RepID=G4CU46_9ACTN|nr:hypothetical protein HMPREF9153_0052 [Cutibacterium avidum ATCC 25577]KXA67558.1 hypothetical protein HMPREF3223_01087 [Cutibacterium avidum]